MDFVDDVCCRMKECCVWLAWTLFAMEIYCTGLLSQKSNVPLQQPKPSRLPTNLSSAHSNICSSFCHNRAHKGLLQCSLFEELWGIIFFQHCWWVLVKMQITWDSQVWVPWSVSRVCALPLTGAWQKLRVEEKNSSLEERGGYGRLSCCVAALDTRNSNCFLNFDLENPPLEIHRTERGGVLCRSLCIFQRPHRRIGEMTFVATCVIRRLSVELNNIYCLIFS